MKKILLTFLLGLPVALFAQDKINKGSLGIGFHLACPQSEIGAIDYDHGFGINFSYLSTKFPYKSPVNFQIGTRMDFAHMQTRKFESIALAADDGPIIIGDATIKAGNRMYGLFLEGRINFTPEDQKITPYISLLAGHRNYSTYQVLSLNQPNYNPERESESITERVVHTKRFHYGGTVGVCYKVNQSISLESSVTYTYGNKGAVLPLKDIERADGSNEVHYDNYQTVKTDILLINAGIRFQLFKQYQYNPINTTPSNQNNSSNSNRYFDNSTPSSSTHSTRKTRSFNSTPTKKMPIKVKSDGPKRDKNDQS